MSKLPAQPSSSSQIDAFLKTAAKLPALSQVKGRLIFAIDATMSRQPTWDSASEIQSEMFDVAQSVGGLAVQLVFFRGRGEFDASPWTTSAAVLADRMNSVRCKSGFTQLRHVLQHTVREARQTKVGALVYVGDCFEENADVVAKDTGELGLLGVPAFMFHEGDDPAAAGMFREIARLTKGVYARFDHGAAARLRDLLKAAAIYAAGGGLALKRYGEEKGGEILRIAQSMSGK